MKYSIKKFLPLVLPAFISAQNLPLPKGATPGNVNDFNINALYSQYATAAYCPQNTLGLLGGKVNCPNGQCNGASNSIIVEKFDATPTRTGGFVAVDEGLKLIVVAIRGATDIPQFLTLLGTASTQTNANSFCTGCLVSTPFLNGYSEVNKKIINAVTKAAQQNPGFKVLTVGHSYGGALSNLAAIEIRNLPLNLTVDLATYGAPRVGNPAFATFLSSQNNQTRPNNRSLGQNFRVVHTGDAIVNLPPMNARQFIILGPTMLFNHTTPSLYLNNPSGTLAKPTDLFMIPGPDTDINLGTLVQQVQAHRWYFNAISFCETLPPPGTFPPPNGRLASNMLNPDLKKDVEALRQFYISNNITFTDN